MQKVAPHVATRGRLLSQITASQRVDAALWPSDRHPDSGPKIVVFAAFPGLIKSTSLAQMTHLFWPSSLFIFISISYSYRCIFFFIAVLHSQSGFHVWFQGIYYCGEVPCWRGDTRRDANNSSIRLQLSRGPIKGHFSLCISVFYWTTTRVRLRTHGRPCVCLHIHTAGGQGQGGGGGGGVALFVTCDSVPDRFEERAESKMPLNDWNVEGHVTALSKRATKGWRNAALNAGSCSSTIWLLRGAAKRNS